MVYRGHKRTSTYLKDAINTLCNVVDHFQPGETYNIGGDYLHTIEELSDLVIKVTGADDTLVRYEKNEAMTTKEKKVDISKAVKDLDHKNSYSLEEGIQLTFEWMQKAYGFM